MNAAPNMSVVCVCRSRVGIRGAMRPQAERGPRDCLLSVSPWSDLCGDGSRLCRLIRESIDHSTTGPVSKICQSLGPSSFTL
jgi:hypothetical protein